MNEMTAIDDTVFGKSMLNTTAHKKQPPSITKAQVNALLDDIELACKKHGISFYMDYEISLNVDEYEPDSTRKNLLSNGVIINE